MGLSFDHQVFQRVLKIWQSAVPSLDLATLLEIVDLGRF